MKSGSPRTSKFATMQPPKYSPQSLQLQNSKENNHDVVGAYYFNNADFDSTQSNCTY